LFADVCPVPSTLKVERNPTTGELLGYNEVFIHCHVSSVIIGTRSCVVSRKVQFNGELIFRLPVRKIHNTSVHPNDNPFVWSGLL